MKKTTELTQTINLTNKQTNRKTDRQTHRVGPQKELDGSKRKLRGLQLELGRPKRELRGHRGRWTNMELVKERERGTP